MDRLAKAGESFQVERIEDTIDVSFTVHLRQSNPAFGQENANLSGRKVNDRKCVQEEVTLKCPLREAAAKASLIGNDEFIAPEESSLSESKRRQIFFELVKAQDAGVGIRESYTLIARKYGLPERMLSDIAYEGVAKKWAMP